MFEKINNWLTAPPVKKKKEDHPFMPQFLLDFEYKIDSAFRYVFWFLIIPLAVLIGIFATFDTAQRILIDIYHTLATR